MRWICNFLVQVDTFGSLSRSSKRHSKTSNFFFGSTCCPTGTRSLRNERMTAKVCETCNVTFNLAFPSRCFHRSEVTSGFYLPVGGFNDVADRCTPLWRSFHSAKLCGLNCCVNVKYVRYWWLTLNASLSIRDAELRTKAVLLEPSGGRWDGGEVGALTKFWLFSVSHDHYVNMNNDVLMQYVLGFFLQAPKNTERRKFTRVETWRTVCTLPEKKKKTSSLHRRPRTFTVKISRCGAAASQRAWIPEEWLR